MKKIINGGYIVDISHEMKLFGEDDSYIGIIDDLGTKKIVKYF